LTTRKGRRDQGHISNRIKALRKAQGLTQQDLAERIGATRQTINAIEAEKYAPSLELAFRIARVLDQAFEAVFSYTEDENRRR